MKKRKKLSQIIFSIVAVMITCSLVFLGLLSIQVVWKLTARTFKSNSQQVAYATKSMVDNRMNLYKDKIQGLINETDFNDIQEVRKRICLLAEGDKTILNMYFADALTNEFVQVLDEEVEDFIPTEASWYEPTVSKPNEFNKVSPYNDIVTNKSVETIFKAVQKDGEIYGVIGLDIDLDEFSKELEGLKAGQNGTVAVVDSKTGFVVSHTDSSKIGGVEPTEYEKWDEVCSNNQGLFKLNYNDVAYETFYETSGETNWKIIVMVPNKELSGPIYKLAFLIFITEVVTIIISLTVTLFSLKGLNKAIEKIVNILKRISNGELNFELDLKTSIQEISSIKDTLEEMMKNMRQLLSRVDFEAEGLKNDSVKYLSLSEEIAVSIEQVHTTINEITQGTIQSAEGLESIAGEMSELSNSLERMESGSGEVNTMAIETNNLSGKGLTMVSTVMDKAQETMDSTSQVKVVVEDVSESIAKIKMINETIKEFTDQTNLLALNAAIEAARAGESGKGFAVVAEEIRKLAEETAVSSEQIDNIVREVDEKSKMAAQKVESTVEIVQAQNDAVDETKRVFSEIISSIESLTERVYNINDGVSKINGMKGKVLDQVENLSAILQETAAGTEEVTASSQEVASAAQDFVCNFKEMKKTAEELKDNVSKFKI